MSTWNDKAELIQARLQTLAVLAGIPVEIDRQKNVESVVANAINKERGACITILLEAAALGEPGSLTSRPAYLVNIVTVPILRTQADAKADDLAEAAALAIHGHLPTPTSHCDEEFLVTGDIALIPHPKYLIYSFPVSTRAIHQRPILLAPEPDPEPDPEPTPDPEP
jgi:hypothetical protein